MTVIELRVDDKGRLLLPAAARAEAGLTPGSRVLGRVEHGRLIVEAPEAIQERIWARAARGGDVPEDRAATAAAERRSLVSREREAGGVGVDAVGEELLADLGL